VRDFCNLFEALVSTGSTGARIRAVEVQPQFQPAMLFRLDFRALWETGNLPTSLIGHFPNLKIACLG
jgi:hypothetical protein